MKKDLKELPKIRDSFSFLYVEHCSVEQDLKSVSIIDKTGKTRIPAAVLTVLLLGPGTKITHAAVKTLSDNGCNIVWCGQGIFRFYSFGAGETRSSKNLLKQAEYWGDKEKHLEVVKKMYEVRFSEKIPNEFNLKQIRGKEGRRIRDAYYISSKKTGIKWNGRNYNYNWDDTDEINKMLSIANSCLYGVCHSAIVSLGYSPSLGFIHTGKQLSFVYDIADIYKVETTIPTSFVVCSKKITKKEKYSELRTQLRKAIHNQRILKRIPEDLNFLFDSTKEYVYPNEKPVEIWDSDKTIPGGQNFSE